MRMAAPDIHGVLAARRRKEKMARHYTRKSVARTLPFSVYTYRRVVTLCELFMFPWAFSVSMWRKSHIGI